MQEIPLHHEGTKSPEKSLSRRNSKSEIKKEKTPSGQDVQKMQGGGGKTIEEVHAQKPSDTKTESSTSNRQLDSALDPRKAAILEASQDNAEKQATARAILADPNFSQKDSYEQLLHKEMLRITEKRDEVLKGKLAMLDYPEDGENEYWHRVELKSLDQDQRFIHEKLKAITGRDPYA